MIYIYKGKNMIKKLQFFTKLLLIIIIIFSDYAAESASCSDSGSASINVARRANSLMQAYMTAKLEANIKEGAPFIRYSDYADASIIYVESLQEAYEILSGTYGEVSFKISGLQSFDIHMHLRIRSKEHQIEYLRNLSEIEKLQLQAIRLYEFITNQHYFLSRNTRLRLEPICSDITLSEKQKWECIKGILGEDFEDRLEIVQENRKSLAVAMKENNVQAINTACGKPFYLPESEFISIDKFIQERIADLEL